MVVLLKAFLITARVSGLFKLLLIKYRVIICYPCHLSFRSLIVSSCIGSGAAIKTKHHVLPSRESVQKSRAMSYSHSVVCRAILEKNGATEGLRVCVISSPLEEGREIDDVCKEEPTKLLQHCVPCPQCLVLWFHEDNMDLLYGSG